MSFSQIGTNVLTVAIGILLLSLLFDHPFQPVRTVGVILGGVFGYLVGQLLVLRKKSNG